MFRAPAPIRWTAALAVTLSLGFGAAQAAAAPGPGREVAACSNSYCSWSCVKQGYDGGTCLNGECVCLYAWP